MITSTTKIEVLYSMLCLLLLVASMESRAIRHSHMFTEGDDTDFLHRPSSVRDNLQPAKNGGHKLLPSLSSPIVKRALAQVFSPFSVQRASNLVKKVNADARIAEYYAKMLRNCRTVGCGMIEIVSKDEGY